MVNSHRHELFVFLTQMHQGQGSLGEEVSDVDIEGYEEEEEEDGKPKTPPPVSMLIESLWLHYTLTW